MPPTTSRRLAPVLLFALALWVPASPEEMAEGPFDIHLVEPQPLYLVGGCRIRASAVDSAGEPFDKRIAYMTLTVDGGEPLHDGQAPFVWEIELGEDLREHRLELTAVSKNGSKRHLTSLSSAHPFIEAVGVNLVLVPVVVREAGAAGRVIEGLPEELFTILEDGVEQPIISFSDEPLPASIVIALDNSQSMDGQLWSAGKAVREFMESLPRYSTLSLLTFNDQVFLEEGFTSDRKKLAAAVSRARVEGSRTALNEALRIGSRHLGKRPGARVLVIFTDGEDTLDSSTEGYLRTAIETAQATDVTVFAIAYGNADRSALERMTVETGGDMVPARGAGELRAAFSRIAESLGSRYVIGYEPPEPDKRGYRKVHVRVSQEGVRVLARTGYRMRSD
jgi:VWFA-related protein